MNIDRITYKKKFPTGMFLNEDIGFECSIESTDEQEILDGIKQLRALAEKSHREQYPYLYTSNGKPITIEQVPDTIIDSKEKQLQNFIEAINTSTSLKAVEIFRKLVERENNPDLTKAFEEKILSFQ